MPKKTTRKKVAKKPRARPQLSDTKMTFLVVFANDTKNVICIESFTEFLPRKGELVCLGKIGHEIRTPYYRVLETAHVVEHERGTRVAEVHAPIVFLDPNPENVPWQDPPVEKEVADETTYTT